MMLVGERGNVHPFRINNITTELLFHLAEVFVKLWRRRGGFPREVVAALRQGNNRRQNRKNQYDIRHYRPHSAVKGR